MPKSEPKRTSERRVAMVFLFKGIKDFVDCADFFMMEHLHPIDQQ
jgi:hypothetical protein